MVPKPVYNKSSKRHGSMQQTLFARQDERELNDAKVTITKLEKELKILIDKNKKEKIELEALGAGFKAEIISLQKSLKVDKRKATELENELIEINTIKSKIEVELLTSTKTLNSLDPDSTQHFQPTTLLKLEQNNVVFNDILSKLKSSKETLDNLQYRIDCHNYEIIKFLPEEISRLTQDLKDKKEQVPHLKTSIIRVQSKKASIPIWSQNVQELKLERGSLLKEFKPIQTFNERIGNLFSKYSLIESTLKGGTDMHNTYVQDLVKAKATQKSIKISLEEIDLSIKMARTDRDRLQNRLTDLDTQTATANSLIEPLTETLRTAKLIQIKIVNNSKVIQSTRSEISKAKLVNVTLIDLLRKVEDGVAALVMNENKESERKKIEENERIRIEREEEEKFEEETRKKVEEERERYNDELRILSEELNRGREDIASLEKLLESKLVAQDERRRRRAIPPTPTPIRSIPTPNNNNHQIKSSATFYSSSSQINTPSQLVTRLATTMKTLSEGLKNLRIENTELLLQLVEVDY